jgi:extracellular elastinolytic metalloproteinase
LNFTTTTLSAPAGNPVVFNPDNKFGDDQKLLNIFYFCNYMHDFLYLIGFDEAAGNFQQINFTHTGVANDPVLAHAHSGRVSGTANMATGPDGKPPVMNMGLVSGDRHTAFDADVVFHEYTHGLTNRLVGGLMQGHALDDPQSSGMGEGWSDYFALTIQNFFRARNSQPEKTVTGDWVVNRPGGIRTAPYDDNYPVTYAGIAEMSDEHDVGEVWCAALMMVTRRVRAALGSDVDGYRLCWTLVTDGLKLTPANPSFIQARDGILLALDQLRDQHRISQDVWKASRKAAWEGFAHFGMGVHASSADAELSSAIADTSLPADL